MNDSMVSIQPRGRKWAAAGLALISLALAATLVTGMASAKPAPYKLVKGVYNARYCEIFLVNAVSGKFQADIYNTIGINDCPDDKWHAIVDNDGTDPSLDSIAAVNGADLAMANGPRHWVLDAIGGRNVGPTVEFGGLPLRKVASATFAGQPTPFSELTIRRSTQWIFKKGRRVRVLLAPNGRRYVMQAYAGSDTKTEAELDPRNTAGADGGGIPTDWQYKTFKVKKRWVLTAPTKATIIRDGLLSVYQRYK